MELPMSNTVRFANEEPFKNRESTKRGCPPIIWLQSAGSHGRDRCCMPGTRDRTPRHRLSECRPRSCRPRIVDVRAACRYRAVSGPLPRAIAGENRERPYKSVDVEPLLPPVGAFCRGIILTRFQCQRIMVSIDRFPSLLPEDSR